MITRTIAAGVLATGLALASATVGHAQKPDVERYEEIVSELDPFLSELCGFPIWADTNIRGTFWERGDTIKVNERGVVAFSANGKTVTLDWARNLTSTVIETVNEEAGTVTVEFNDVFTGMPERVRGTDGATLLKDRGRLELTGTAVIDLESGELIDLVENVRINGPHPIFEQGFLDPSQLCDPLAA